MTIIKRLKICLGFALLAMAAFIAPAQANANVNVNFSNPAFAPVTGLTSIPIGHAVFCQTRPEECGPNRSVVNAVALTEQRWRELVNVNAQFNSSIVSVSDIDLYQVEEFWTYANGYGDCEEYALAKRRELINRGWNPSALLIAVLRQTSGEGHAVLMVRTDRGDMVLDNLAGLIKTWDQTPYQYIKRQSQTNAGQWVDIADNRPMTTLNVLLAQRR